MEITAHGIACVHVYNTADGESHIEDLEYSMATTNHGLIAENVATEEVVLRVWNERPDVEAQHVAPRRQLVIHLSGSAEVETSDGDRRTLASGSIMLTEDTEGKGHTIRSLELPRMAMFVPLLAKRKGSLIW